MCKLTYTTHFHFISEIKQLHLATPPLRPFAERVSFHNEFVQSLDLMRE